MNGRVDQMEWTIEWTNGPNGVIHTVGSYDKLVGFERGDDLKKNMIDE